MFDEKVSRITTKMASIRENISTLPDEIEVDLHDLPRVEKYLAFSREIERFLSDFDRVSQSLKNIIRRFSENPNPPPNEGIIEGMPVDVEELLAILSNEQVHYVNEHFTRRKPYAIILEDKPYWVNTWASLYVKICLHFLNNDRERMLTYIAGAGRYFAKNREAFTTGGKELETNLFVDTGLSTHDTCRRISRIFSYFRYPPANLKIFLIGDSDTGERFRFMAGNANHIDNDLVP